MKRTTGGRASLTVAVLVAAQSACSTVGFQSPAPAVRLTSSPAPRTILVRGENLVESRRRLAAGDAMLRPAYDALIDSAQAALAEAPVSVTQKTRTPPSGDKHDYMSLAPYWWPDTTKPGGVPFVRRDGVVNPESRVDHDGWRMYAMMKRVEALSLAYWFTGEERYAEGAAKHLRVWFLDPATRMNPNLRFGQAIPGVTEGRGIGIIDTRYLPQIVDAIRLLDGSSALSSGDRAGLEQWCRDYLRWMLESPQGKEERAAENNHGNFYDEQIAALALFVGDSAVARRTLRESAPSRIAKQIARDGRQPLELERTRPLHYSLFNLDALTMIAEMGRHAGIDLWRYAGPGGGSVLDALRFVAPYADSLVTWPTPQVTNATPDVFMVPLRRALAGAADPQFAAAVRALPADIRATDRLKLLYPAVRVDTSVDSVARAALQRAAAQIRRSATNLDPANGFPRSTKPDGGWTQVPAGQWTSGFFAGTLWYLYQHDRAPEWRALAERWTAGPESSKSMTNTHDLGFIIFDSFGHGYLLTGDPHYRDVVMEASRSLATRFNPMVGAIKSWDTERVSDARSAWKYPVIVDNLMNLEMLFWAGHHGGDSAWARIAERHALTSARAHVRSDGSTAHVALFDPATGALERTVTWQGYADTSAWARGQAWAIHGFTRSYVHTRRPELLAAATRAADWFIDHLPADGVPYWDFRHPGIPNAERDASAAAIAASGLYDLARWAEPSIAARYRAAADRMIAALATRYMAPATPDGAVLLHSTGNRPQGGEIDVGIVYADYFFVEALLRREGRYVEDTVRR
jgi:unsaturated chondroitin disaccharide hydrolase